MTLIACTAHIGTALDFQFSGHGFDAHLEELCSFDRKCCSCLLYFGKLLLKTRLILVLIHIRSVRISGTCYTTDTLLKNT